MEQIADPVEVRRRMERLVRRLESGDYGILLRNGEVVRRVDEIGGDPEPWRAEIRRQARADKLKVRTYASSGVVVMAVLEARHHVERDGWGYMRFATVIRQQAEFHGHLPEFVIRDGDEVVFGCSRCKALGFGDRHEGVYGGNLFEDCAGESSSV